MPDPREEYIEIFKAKKKVGKQICELYTEQRHLETKLKTAQSALDWALREQTLKQYPLLSHPSEVRIVYTDNNGKTVEKEGKVRALKTNICFSPEDDELKLKVFVFLDGVGDPIDVSKIEYIQEALEYFLLSIHTSKQKYLGTYVVCSQSLRRDAPRLYDCIKSITQESADIIKRSATAPQAVQGLEISCGFNLFLEDKHLKP